MGGPVDANGMSVGAVGASWFGFVGDGKTDNSAAWNSFSSWARLQTSGVVIKFSPGVYNFDHSKCLNFLQNIKFLRMIAYGAVFQNTYSGGAANGGAARSWSIAGNGISASSAWLIQQTTIGATSFSLVNASDAANISVGDLLLATSRDIQYYGYPPNADLLEFWRVASVDFINNVIGIDRQIRWEHRTDYPEVATSPFPCGKARVWAMSWGGITGDIDHTYEGMSILQAPNGTAYQTATGRKIRYLNCPALVGPSPTVIEDIEYENCGFLTAGEPDKLIDHAGFVRCWGPSLGWQSSSVNRVRLVSPRLGGYNIGTAKVTDITDPDIGMLSYGNTYGAARRASIRGGFVRAIQNPAADLTGGTNQNVDGVNVSFANGTFTILKAGTQLTHWGLIEGLTCNLASTATGFSGDIGSGVVTALRDDAANVYVDTTLPFATLPPWASGAVRFSRTGDIRFYGVTGCDDARHASYANSLGLREWEILTALFANTTATGGAFSLNKWCGSITEITVNVRQASALAGAVFMLNSYMVSASTLSNQQEMTLKIDVTTAGKRVLSQAAWTNQAAADALTFGGVNAKVLPAAQLITGLSWGLTAKASPIIELKIKFDTGMYGKPIVLQADASGNLIANVTGSIP